MFLNPIHELHNNSTSIEIGSYIYDLDNEKINFTIHMNRYGGDMDILEPIFTEQNTADIDYDNDKKNHRMDMRVRGAKLAALTYCKDHKLSSEDAIRETIGMGEYD